MSHEQIEEEFSCKLILWFYIVKIVEKFFIILETRPVATIIGDKIEKQNNFDFWFGNILWSSVCVYLWVEQGEKWLSDFQLLEK